MLVCGDAKEQSPPWTWGVGSGTKEEERKKGGAEALRGLHHPGGQGFLPKVTGFQVLRTTQSKSSQSFFSSPDQHLWVPKRYKVHCEAGASVYMLASWRQSLVPTQPQ